MKEIGIVGLDIAKSLFQVHAISAAGEVMVRKNDRALVGRSGGDTDQQSQRATTRPGRQRALRDVS